MQLSLSDPSYPWLQGPVTVAGLLLVLLALILLAALLVALWK